MFFLIAVTTGFVTASTLPAMLAAYGIARIVQGLAKSWQFFFVFLIFSSVILFMPYLLMFTGVKMGTGYGYGGGAVLFTAFLSCLLLAVINALIVCWSLRKGSFAGYKRNHFISFLVAGLASVISTAALIHLATYF